MRLTLKNSTDNYSSFQVLKLQQVYPNQAEGTGFGEQYPARNGGELPRTISHCIFLVLIITRISSEACTCTEMVPLDPWATRPPAQQSLPAAAALNPVHCAAAHGFYRGNGFI